MKTVLLVVFLGTLSVTPCLAQSQAEKKQVLQVVEQFFQALEKRDSVAWDNLYVKDARKYFVGMNKDSVELGVQNPFTFRVPPDLVIKERMRSAVVKVELHKNIAMVWAPYDLWVNDQYSHCGVDVFTLLKTSAGWKIATCAFSMEKEGCGRSASGK